MPGKKTWHPHPVVKSDDITRLPTHFMDWEQHIVGALVATDDNDATHFPTTLKDFAQDWMHVPPDALWLSMI